MNSRKDKGRKDKRVGQINHEIIKCQQSIHDQHRRAPESAVMVVLPDNLPENFFLKNIAEKLLQNCIIVGGVYVVCVCVCIRAVPDMHFVNRRRLENDCIL